MILHFHKAKKYLIKAEKDIKEADAEDAMFHIRRCLESLIEEINKSLGFKYDSLRRDDFLVKAISDLSENKIITLNQASSMHKIRAASNQGIHNDINEDVGGLFLAKDTYKTVIELYEDLKKNEWESVKQENRYKRKTKDVTLTMSPFVPKI